MRSEKKPMKGLARTMRGQAYVFVDREILFDSYFLFNPHVYILIIYKIKRNIYVFHFTKGE